MGNLKYNFELPVRLFIDIALLVCDFYDFVYDDEYGFILGTIVDRKVHLLFNKKKTKKKLSFDGLLKLQGPNVHVYVGEGFGEARCGLSGPYPDRHRLILFGLAYFLLQFKKSK